MQHTAYLLGGSYQPSQTLSVFDGENYSGDWRLTVSDNAGGDVGVLEQWCLLPTFEPDIQVEPSSLAAAQPPDTQTMQTLMIYNNGAGNLSWHIFESFASAVQRVHAQVKESVQSRIPAENLGPATDEVDLMADAPLASSRQQSTAPSVIVSPDDNHVLYDNGPLVNAPGAGADGADASVVQSVVLGMSTLGFANQADFDNRVADEFTITDPNGWIIESITFYAYQTGSPVSPTIASTITDVNYQIWDGPPDDPCSQVVFGDLVNNRLAETGWSGIYRTADNPGNITSTLRPIMTNIVDAGVVLPPGTYWLDWQSDGSDMYSGPWAPPITIDGVITTGNGLQFFAGTWQTANDSGTAAQQGFPFILSDYPVGDIPWVSTSPISGTTSGNATTQVAVNFDSTGLDLGVYTGTLYIESNDLDTPLIAVPLTLTVELHYIYLPFVMRSD